MPCTQPRSTDELCAALAHASLKAAALTIMLAPLAGCGDDGGADDQGGAQAQACHEAWTESYGQRFNSGETWFLPAILDEARCAGQSWSLTSAPSGNSNALINGDDGFARFTPHVTGEYTFTLGDETVTLEVIDALERPFHNHNYFPSTAAATLVDGELWVAGVYSPQVARLNPATGEALDPILVGQWPVALANAESAGVVLVANKGSDTLGVIDVDAGRQIDGIWVGDEPTEIVWDDARGLAYVSLAGAGQVAIVDVAQAALVKTLDAVFDPAAMAMTPDGQRLLVASHRSGLTNIFPYDVREVETEQDVAIINLDTQSVDGHILEVASTIQAMKFDAEGQLWVTATRNNLEGSLNDPEARSFEHQLFVLEVEAGVATRGAEVDLSRQATSTGSTATIQGFSICGDSIWVVAEGSNQVVELGGDLTEQSRVEVEGRPRAIVCADGTPWVISSNRMKAMLIQGGAAESFDLGLTERRDALLIDGLELFNGQGDGVGDNRSCGNCHVDGLSDGVVWNAGPVENRQVTRPLRWLEGTSLIGWDGYVGSVKISGYVGGSTINRRGNTAESKAMGAYLASLMPAPAANSLTRRDGSLSAVALEGKALFEGEGACAGCHAGAVTTNKQVFPDGLTPGKTDVPTLVDVAKVGAWYKTGIMPTLRDTVADTVDKFSAPLDDDGIDKVTRYLGELTGRDFFILNADLGPDAQRFPIDGEVVLTFSYPVLNEPSNLARITMLDDSGVTVEVDARVDGRHVTLTASEPLDHDAAYTLEVPEGFLADDGRAVLPEQLTMTTASAPALKMSGDYTLTVRVPVLDFMAGEFDLDNFVEQSSTFVATETANGADVLIDYGADMVYDDLFVISGDKLVTNHFPVAVGPTFLNGTPLDATVQDTDGDGVIDLIEATHSLTGPGVDLEEISITIAKATASPGGCVPGTEGDAAPTITQDGDDVIIDWEGGALALFVADPEATLPLGPGAVMGGETYWGVSAASFPNTFEGPVTYGTVPEGGTDVSADNGAPVGGAALESGKCYRFSVVVDFAYSHTTVLWP